MSFSGSVVCELNFSYENKKFSRMKVNKAFNQTQSYVAIAVFVVVAVAFFEFDVFEFMNAICD